MFPLFDPRDAIEAWVVADTPDWAGESIYPGICCRIETFRYKVTGSVVWNVEVEQWEQHQRRDTPAGLYSTRDMRWYGANSSYRNKLDAACSAARLIEVAHRDEVARTIELI